MRYAALLMISTLILAVPSARAYDYSEPMATIPGLPLGSPEKPFVLRFTEQELLAQPIWNATADAIIVQANAPSPIRLGAQALQQTLHQLSTRQVPIVEVAADQRALPASLAGNYFIVMGVPGDFALAASLVRDASLTVTDTAMNGDGFHIKPIESAGRNLLLIASPVARGVMYGAYELEERTTHRGIPRIDQAFVPRMRYRGWPIHNHEVPTPLGASGRWRYNMSLEYCAFWPRTLPFQDYPELGGAQHKDEIARQQKALHTVYADVARYGSAPTIFFNFLSLQWAPIGLEAARKALAEKHPGILAQPADKYTYSLCPSHPETRRLVASMTREMVKTFPELEVLVLQQSDEGGELLCECDQCRKTSYLDKLVDYTNLIIAAAKDVKPTMRFLVFGSGVVNKMAADTPALAAGPTMGMDVLRDRLGSQVEAYVLMATTPPGFDVQTWLSPDSTMLGQGIPLYYLFHWYEAGGPGIAAPISTVMSHLSWPLPVYLDKLKKYAAPDTGMVGAASPVTGMDVAWWHPDLNPDTYMRNWCRAKYGKQPGDCVYDALRGTHKITEAFHLDTKPNANESLDLYRWGEASQPWAVDMEPLQAAGLGKDGSGQTTLTNIAKLGFMFPQAPRPEALKTLDADTLAPWLKRFDLTDEIGIGDRCETQMAKAVSLAPEDAELRRLAGLAKATNALIHLFRDYHRAMLYAAVAHNAAETAEKAKWAAAAREHLMKAAENAAVYTKSMLPLTEHEKLFRLKRDTEMLYVAGTACMVREAAFLFDNEFGGDSILNHYDEAMGLKRSS